jgi:hypothetical protein
LDQKKIRVAGDYYRYFRYLTKSGKLDHRRAVQGAPSRSKPDATAATSGDDAPLGAASFFSIDPKPARVTRH